MENKKFYSNRFKHLKNSTKYLLIFEIITILVVSLFHFVYQSITSDTLKALIIFQIVIGIFKIIFIHDMKRYAYYYEYDLETGRDLYDERDYR
jgi:hypothetical protein